MNNKVLIFGIGVAFGYLLGRELMGKGITLPKIEAQTVVKSQKELNCEKELEQQLQVIKLGSETSLSEYKKEFMRDCLNKNATV
jgi:hypothetical protein